MDFQVAEMAAEFNVLVFLHVLSAKQQYAIVIEGVIQLFRRLRVQRPGKIEIQDLGTNRCSRSEEHTSELQSLMRISYAVFCLKKKITIKYHIEKRNKQN